MIIMFLIQIITLIILDGIILKIVAIVWVLINGLLIVSLDNIFSKTLEEWGKTLKLVKQIGDKK